MASQSPDFLSQAFGASSGSRPMRALPATTTTSVSSNVAPSSAQGVSTSYERAMKKAVNELNITTSNVAATKTLVTNAAITGGAAALSSAVEGYFGSNKMQIGGVDVRAVGGFGLVAFGLFQTLHGQKHGTEMVQAGLGTLMPTIVNEARYLGQDYARRMRSPAAPSPSAVPTTPQLPGLGEFDFFGNMANGPYRPLPERQHPQALYWQQPRQAPTTAGTAGWNPNYQGQHNFAGEPMTVGITPPSPNTQAMHMTPTAEEVAGARREITLPPPTAAAHKPAAPDSNVRVSGKEGGWKKLGNLLPSSLDDE